MADLNEALERPEYPDDLALYIPDWTLMFVAGLWQHSNDDTVVCLGDLLQAITEIDNFGLIAAQCADHEDPERGAELNVERCCVVDTYIRCGVEHLDTAAGLIADMYEEWAELLSPLNEPTQLHEYVQLWRDRAAGFRTGKRPGGYWAPEQRARWFDIGTTRPELTEELIRAGVLKRT